MRACLWPGPHSSSRPLHCPLRLTRPQNPAPQFPFIPAPTPSPSLHTAKRRPWRTEIPNSLLTGYETLSLASGDLLPQWGCHVSLPEYSPHDGSRESCLGLQFNLDLIPPLSPGEPQKTGPQAPPTQSLKRLQAWPFQKP